MAAETFWITGGETRGFSGVSLDHLPKGGSQQTSTLDNQRTSKQSRSCWHLEPQPGPGKIPRQNQRNHFVFGRRWVGIYPSSFSSTSSSSPSPADLFSYQFQFLSFPNPGRLPPNPPPIPHRPPACCSLRYKSATLAKKKNAWDSDPARRRLISSQTGSSGIPPFSEINLQKFGVKLLGLAS